MADPTNMNNSDAVLAAYYMGIGHRPNCAVGMVQGIECDCNLKPCGSYLERGIDSGEWVKEILKRYYLNMGHSPDCAVRMSRKGEQHCICHLTLAMKDGTTPHEKYMDYLKSHHQHLPKDKTPCEQCEKVLELLKLVENTVDQLFGKLDMKIMELETLASMTDTEKHETLRKG